MPNSEFAIIDDNALSCMGLKQLLQDIIPMLEISTFYSFEDFESYGLDRFAHIFVSSSIYFTHSQFFISKRKQCIILIKGDSYPNIAGLNTLNVCQSEKAIVKSLLQLQHRGHAAKCGKINLNQQKEVSLLSTREIDVAILLAKGFINKEIAERLNISQTTVITHRKNIMDKLKARSLGDIIIHVVLSGLISVEEL